MFEVFNMGLGFCYVVDPASAERTLRGAGDRHRRLRSAEDRAHRSPRACRAAQAILAGGWGGATRGVIGLQTLIRSSPRGAPRDASVAGTPLRGPIFQRPMVMGSRWSSPPRKRGRER